MNLLKLLEDFVDPKRSEKVMAAKSNIFGFQTVLWLALAGGLSHDAVAEVLDGYEFGEATVEGAPSSGHGATPATSVSSSEAPGTKRSNAEYAASLEKTAKEYEARSQQSKDPASKEALQRVADAARTTAKDLAKGIAVQTSTKLLDSGIVTVVPSPSEAEIKQYGQKNSDPNIKDVVVKTLGSTDGSTEYLSLDADKLNLLRSIQKSPSDTLSIDGTALFALANSSEEILKYRPKDEAVKSSPQSLADTSKDLMAGTRALGETVLEKSSAKDSPSPEDRDEFVAQHLSAARTDLGIQRDDRFDATSSPLYSAAPTEIRDRSQSLFNEVVRNRAAGLPMASDLRPLSDLLGNDQFQDFAERQLGRERLRGINFSVAAAMVGNDKRNGSLILAAVNQSVAEARGLKLNPTDIGVAGSSLFLSKKQGTGGSGKVIAAEPREWIETARLLGRPEARERLLALQRDPARFEKALAVLEEWLRELNSLKAQEGLKAVVSPFDSPNPEFYTQARWDFERALRMLSRGPQGKAPQDDLQTSWVRLMTHASAQVKRLKSSVRADRDLEIVRITFADRAVAEDWRRLSKGTYLETRQAAGRMVLFKGLADLADPQSRLHYVVSAAFEDIDLRRSLKKALVADSELGLPRQSVPSRSPTSFEPRPSARLSFDDVD